MLYRKLVFLSFGLTVFHLTALQIQAQPNSAVNPLGVLDERYGSLSYVEPCDILLGENGDCLFVLNAMTRDLRKLSLIDDRPAQVLQLPVKPERMTLTPDKKHVVVVGGESRGRLLLINAETLRLEKTVEVGHTPSDVTVSATSSAP